MLVDSLDCTLLIVDVQEKLFCKIANFELLNEYLLKTLSVFSKIKCPIVYSEQYPKGLGSTVQSLKQVLESLSCNKLEKTSFSCFPFNEKKSIDDLIRTKQVILCGIETHICILQTALDLRRYGYEVFVVNECVGSRTKINKDLGLQRLKQNDVIILSFEMLVFELLRNSNNKHFKDFSNLIK